jgi:hypothetical protein
LIVRAKLVSFHASEFDYIPRGSRCNEFARREDMTDNNIWQVAEDPTPPDPTLDNAFDPQIDAD